MRGAASRKPARWARVSNGEQPSCRTVLMRCSSIPVRVAARLVRHLGAGILAASVFSVSATLSALHAQSTARLDAAERSKVIDRIAEELENSYVFPDTARSMVRHVRDRLRAGAYDAAAGDEAFAIALTADLRAVSHDKHLRVLARSAMPGRGASPGAGPAGPGGPGGGDGLSEVKTLDGNIGYLKFTGFADVSRVGAHIESAMAQLVSTDALIIDLRENGGGSPNSVMYLAGYLFPEKTLIARIYSRPDDATSEMWTADVKGKKYLGKNVYILTSRRTFSAAEAAAYHLQAFGRAKTVGDTTGGGAHRVNGVVLDDRFTIMVPMTRPTNIKTGTDWEGVGVLPDIAIDSERALVKAQLEALRTLPTTPDRARAIAALEQADRKP